MSSEPEKPRKKSKRPPLWLRIILMILLILFVSFAFYTINLDLIEEIGQR